MNVWIYRNKGGFSERNHKAALPQFVRRHHHSSFLIFSHRSVEPGHRYMQEMLGCRQPLLDLNFRLGEGTGAAVAMNLVEGAVAILTEVATFAEAAVAGADK